MRRWDQANIFDFLGHRPSLGNLQESFHVTHSMTSERCLPACAVTQTGFPTAIKAMPQIDHQTIFGNGDAKPVCVSRIGRIPRGFLETHRLA